MQKIAVTSEGPTLDDKLDQRFGRAAGYIVVDPETMEFEYINNADTQTVAQGAGIQAAQTVAGSGATVLLTGSVGPKAYAALSRAKVRVGQNLGGLTVREAVERFRSGDIDWAESPNTPGHRA